MRRTLQILILVLFIGCPLPTQGQTQKNTSDKPENKIGPDVSTVVSMFSSLPDNVPLVKLSALPNSVKTYYGTRSWNQLFAKSGEPWQLGCLRNGLPKRKLVFAADLGSNYAVCYLTGGYGTNSWCDVFGKTGTFQGTVRHLQLRGQQSPRTFKDLRRLIVQNQFVSGWNYPI